MTNPFEEEICDGCLKSFPKIEMYSIGDYDELVMLMCAECYQPGARSRGKRR